MGRAPPSGLLWQPRGRASGRIVTKHFSAFRFDVEDGTLWRGAEQVPLTGKAASLLRCLLGRAGTWVSKSAIMSAVWPDTHVQPDNVKVLVREIRQALGDDPRQSKFIRSAPGRGYSFVADVSEARQASALEPVERGARADFRQPRPGVGRTGRRARCGPRLGTPLRADIGRARGGEVRTVRCLRANGSRRGPSACLSRSIFRPRAAARTLLRIPGRAHRPRSSASGIRAASAHRERAILAGAVSAVERRGNACGSCRADVRRVGRRARRAVIRSAAHPHPRRSPVG